MSVVWNLFDQFEGCNKRSVLTGDEKIFKKGKQT